MSEIQDGGFESSVAQISVYTHDGNEIPTATPMFPWSGNTDRLLGIRFHACMVMSLIEDGDH